MRGNDKLLKLIALQRQTFDTNSKIKYMPTIFQKIINREIPAHIVAENKYCIAFLDINPITEGHVIAISKTDSSDYIFDMDILEYTRLMSFVREVSIAMKLAIPCKRIGTIIAGFEIPHAHIHLLPINNSSVLNFNSTPLKISNSRMEEIANLISRKYAGLK